MNPEQRAARLRADHGDARIPVPVDAIAQAAGYRIVRKRPDGAAPIGFLARSAAGDPVVGISTSASRGHQNFALAHLLGHGEMHAYDLLVDQEIRTADAGPSLASWKEEAEATRFAVELLLPAVPFLDRARAHLAGEGDGRPDRDRLIKHLATQFLVSHEAIAFRLVDLAVMVP